MKGRETFTKNEINKIEKLISLKVVVSTTKQKGIRNKIRDMGFYYSNYSSSKHGYTIHDLRALIKSKCIIIIG